MSLSRKPIRQLTIDDITSLMGDIPVKEGQNIDYKRDMIRSEKLCEVVTSFANSQGGDLIIGIDEVEGIPTEVIGVESVDIDKEELRLRHIFNNGIEPRIAIIDIEFISVDDAKYVIVIAHLEVGYALTGSTTTQNSMPDSRMVSMNWMFSSSGRCFWVVVNFLISMLISMRREFLCI
ncbi:helix-turn-helix domain-containing protein [Paenibacillus sp. S150]|uniref:AlbA family DNA-binding domain-containing protein n=1 Tax=Paenibacillus sp. S150 TaxID=2749826 RepID=UPI001C58B5E0|nr:ATP-binding protein [Paenibacillus sp. S150]MBW4080264.1 ATP-binding protein [Paenibacillus sp. S150]